MLLAYDGDGLVLNFLGFRDNYTNEMIDALQPFEGFHNYRIYDKEMIDRIHEAIDTGGTVRVELDPEGNYLGLIIENGSLEPAPDVPFEPDRTPIEILQRENEILKAQNKAITDRADFIDDVIAEMAMKVYQ